METLRKARRAAKPRLPQRSVRWLQRPERHFDNWGAIEITVGKQVDAYLIRRISTDYGLAGFALSKLDSNMTETGTYYHVLLHGHESKCDCRGCEAHRQCKHLDAVLALMRANPFEDAVTVPAPRPSEAEVARAVREAPQWWHVKAEERPDGSWCIAARYHFDCTVRVEAQTADDLVSLMRLADSEREAAAARLANEAAKRISKPVPPPNPPAPTSWWLAPATRLSDGSEEISVRFGDQGAGGRLHRRLSSPEWRVLVGWGPECRELGTVRDPAEAIAQHADTFRNWLPNGRRESSFTGD